jgi:MFS family permease
MDLARIQRRTLSLLFATQMMGGVGVAIGIAVGALLTAQLAGTAMSGLASSVAVVGGALVAVPATRLIRTRGRRPGLVFGYGCGTLGAVTVVAGAGLREVPVLLLGMLLFGGGTAANLQARYAAVDLARPAHRGRQLALIVWATTIGAVAGPNLAPLADRYGRSLGLAQYAGPFAFSALAFLAGGAAIGALLRPDPLLTARAAAVRAQPARVAAGPGTDGRVAARTGADDGVAEDPAAVPASGVGVHEAVAVPLRGAGLREALSVVWARPSARLGVCAVAVGHVVMVSVMSMTPVHISGYVSGHGDVLRVVGLVLSLHVLGMYALSPLVGWLTDRLGRRPVILAGVATLLVACAFAGLAGHRTPLLSVGLTLLGLGWSGTMVAGSTLLSESVPARVRPSAQGLSDMVMGLAAAVSGALAGIVVSWFGYATLTLLAALATVPLVALVLRPGAGRPVPPGPALASALTAGAAAPRASGPRAREVA